MSHEDWEGIFLKGAYRIDGLIGRDTVYAGGLD